MTMSGTATTTTIGMRLDAVLDQCNSLSSTQLYVVIVSATIGMCIALMGTKHNSYNVEMKQPPPPTVTPPVVHNNHTTKQVPENLGRQPRWHIFWWTNYLCMAGFVYSLAYFWTNASYYLYQQPDQLLHFLVGWSVFVGYFFGFFGISLVHQDIVGPTPNHPGDDVGVVSPPSLVEEPSSTSKGLPVKEDKSIVHKPKKTVRIHEPAHSTPVCSDPTSFTKKASPPSSSSSSTNNKVQQKPALLNLKDLDDHSIAQLVLTNQLKDHELEKRLDPFRAVDVRRIAANQKLATLTNNDHVLDPIPNNRNDTMIPMDYSKVLGANCEIVVGYIPIPVGLVGPLTLNDQSVYVPMATTEGCLVASTNRGAKAISQGSGAFARIVRDGITRAPCVRMASAMEAADLKIWCETPTNFQILRQAFESTTSFGKLKACDATVAGKNVYLRLVCFSGDAMGMNMVSKGSLAVIERLQQEFPSLTLVALSGNMCTDKKAAATNWLHGRGKSVVVEATIPQKVVQTTLKTTVPALVHTNLHKNLIGSAMAGALGGFNAHASNIVTAIFLATGQDPAQNVESSNCITLMEETPEGDLWISCTMPSIEVGTVGGGTSLKAQAACLDVMNCKGGANETPGQNAQRLATIVAASTMAGELSLLAALAANTLVQAHMTHNRKPQQK